MADVAQIREAVMAGGYDTIGALVQEALDEGLAPPVILNDALVAGMNVVGEKFRAGDFFIPEVLIAARAMTAGIDLLRPMLAAGEIKTLGTVVIGTVQGDLHDIGKNLVAYMLQGSGFDVVDLGNDVAPEEFVSACQEHQANIVAMSALLTTTMGKMQSTVEALQEAGLREQVKVMIGGAPVTQSFCQHIGADRYEPDAMSAVDGAKELVGAAA